MSLKIDDNNYETYKSVFEILCGHMYKDLDKIVSSDSHPITVLNSWEIKSKSIAKRGLKAGLLDTLSSIKELAPTTISDINTDLIKNGLPSLNKLAAIIKNTVEKVFQKKGIKDISQFYIIKELLDDNASDITIEERRELSKYLGDFQEKAR